MDKKKIASTGVVMITNCILAVVWILLVFLDLASGSPNVLHITCAIARVLFAAGWVVQFLKLTKKPAEEIPIDGCL